MSRIKEIEELVDKLDPRYMSEVEQTLLKHLQYLLLEKRPKAVSMAKWCIEERDKGNDGCGACSLCCVELRQDLLCMDALRSDNERLHNSLNRMLKSGLPDTADVEEFLKGSMGQTIAPNNYAFAARVISNWIKKHVRESENKSR